MTVRGFANLPSVPPLPSFSERDPDVISANLSSDAWSPTTAVPRGAYTCFFLRVIGLPPERSGSASRFSPRIRLLAGGVFEAADISLCSGLRVCSSPRSFLPLHKVPQGSRDFYIRAERASLPLHAPDMLAVRIQAIDGTRTSTLLDSQPCRPLPSPPPPTARPVSRELPVDRYHDPRWGFPCCVWSPMRTCHRHYPGRFNGACSLLCLHCQRPSPCNSKVGSCNCFFGACSAFTHVTACTLAESPSDPFHRKLRQLCCLRCRFDCYRVERTSSRAGVAPAVVQRLSRRTVTPVKTKSRFSRSPRRPTISNGFPRQAGDRTTKKNRKWSKTSADSVAQNVGRRAYGQ